MELKTVFFVISLTNFLSNIVEIVNGSKHTNNLNRIFFNNSSFNASLKT